MVLGLATDVPDDLLDDPLLDLEEDVFVLSIQWYFLTEGSPVFIRVHFLPDALQDLKQSPIFLPSQVCLEPDVLEDDELDELDSEDFGDFVGLLVGLLKLLSEQWYFLTEGSPVFIRVHFLPDALQDLKQSPIFLPSQVCLEPDVLDDEELDDLDSEDFGDFVGLLVGLLKLLSEQWYFFTEGSPVFIRVHFLPDALQVLKQSPIVFPSHVFPLVVVGDEPEVAMVLGLAVVLGFVDGSALVLVGVLVVVFDLVVVLGLVVVAVGRLVFALGLVVDLLVGVLDELDALEGFDFDELSLDVALGLLVDTLLLQ